MSQTEVRVPVEEIPSHPGVGGQTWFDPFTKVSKSFGISVQSGLEKKEICQGSLKPRAVG